MLKILDISLILLILSLLTNIKSTKVLSAQKKCGDPECETSMSRVLAIKDYTGPDCRYLSFRSGEEIMVYFKLSRKREDLWAGSKGTEFGYFPMDAVQTEEIFVTKEIEVPTKETDFLCLDGGEYVFENEDSIFNHHTEENEYVSLYPDGKDSDFNMPEDEIMKLPDTSIPTEYKGSFSDSNKGDHKAEDLHSLETLHHGDSELRHSKTDQDESSQQEDPITQALNPVPTQSTWTVSGTAGWLGLGSEENKKAVGQSSQISEQITFRRRKIAIADSADLKKQSEESEEEPHSWFQSTLTGLLHFGNEKSGLSLLYKDSDPGIHSSSNTASSTGHQGRTAASEARKDRHSDSELSKSNWFDLKLNDILTFGYTKKNKEQLANGEVDQNEDPLPPNMQSVSVDDGLKEAAVEQMLYDEQGKYLKTNIEQTTESVVDEEQQKEKYEAITSPDITDTEVLPGNEHSDFKNAEASSFSIQLAEKLKSSNTEQDSVSGNQIIENTQESERIKSQSGNGKLPGKALKEKHPLNSNKEPNNDQYSEKNMPPTNTKEKLNTSGKNGLNQQDVKEKVQGNNLMNQSCTTGNESKWLLQIILHLNEFCAVITSVFSSMVSMSKKVVSSLPENMRPGPDLYGFPWEIVICGTIVAIFTILLVLCRSYKSVRSRLYLGREKQLANKVAELVEDKCKVLEKLSLCKKEYAELENTLKDASFLQESIIASNIKTTYEELNNSNSALKNEIECLEKELKGEKSKQSEQDDLVAEIQKRVASLENEAKSIQLQVAEAKTTLKVYEINRERLKTSLQDAVEENGHLHESEKQLLQEAEGWDERFSELNEQTKMFESSQTNMEEALKNKESQVKSLTDGLLRMKDWSCATGEQDSTDDNHGNNDIKSETENGQHLDDPEKETVKKLIYAAKLNACLKSLETERNQLYSKLTDEKKAKEELAERTERLQREHVILQSGNTEFESEVQKLQQKLKVMTELYQENEMNLHRKLTVEEKERLQKEEKLSKVDEKINHAAEELNAYRQRAKDLEEELERTVRSYENQIMSHEKKAHDNWLTARAAERQLNDMRKENLHSRQKLTEAEFKYDILEKDPYAHDDTATAFGREQSPYGPSPMGRPSSETRAFLSPPTLLEGPLRLSPVLPGGGGRGSRGLGNRGTPEVGNERGELNTNRLSDPHRPPSDTGSLSPPWDRDHRVILPHPGHLYNEQSLPPRRPERFYSNPLNSGRLSGPAELRSYNMHSLEKTDGLSSENNLRMDLSGNEIRDHSNGSNMLNIPDQSLPPENETLGSGIVPPPLPFLRAPLMSVDPRGSFMRRGPPFPPLPPGSVYGAQEYFPRDFAGLPRPLLPMRGPFPMRPFSQYPPPPRAGFFPPPPSDNRNELPAELTQLSTVSSTDHQESQQETG
ncbi:endoplasmic reticulum export factor CTAGE5 isoform X3 [Python bivittatus]|uniref:Endoplasmic reticulum export factor CTAGE5 isoform X3 n=1 Tax=Python bivittatus TaxID=176946 RepID=A0A9F5IZ65_PYTBI|nr:endoplasmic reticulum export factor CTAGE5 isoform X3 [Python bivittatus]